MAILGACVAVIESGKILLTQREDFEVWCLPGGHVESGESAAQAAVREAFEETGLKVELTQLIGVYFRNRGDDGIHIFSFLAKPVGGVLKPQLGEVIDVRYFDPNDLPDVLFWGQRQRIQDVLDNLGGSAFRTQKIHWPFEENRTRQEIYDLRDQSGLSRYDFYVQHFGQAGAEQSQSEIGPVE
ncbi:MAG: NUDIX domain-containing protein [bacterium]|nr:NUDIX domain-containing protein [bacterium]